MGKGNMFLGFARGKIGDMVYSRQGGQQVWRARNRNPANPRTEQQLYQRAIMATVSQAYSAGKEIFNHSFQGFRVGMENQMEFSSRNIEQLRGLISQEQANGVPGRYSNVRVVAPKTGVAVPWAGMILSKGTYPQQLFNVFGAHPATLEQSLQQWGYFTCEKWIALNSPYATIGDLYDDGSLKAGDLYTWVMFYVDTDTMIFDGPSGLTNQQQYACDFCYAQLMVKEPTDEIRALDHTNAHYGDIFDIYKTNMAKVEWAEGSATLFGAQVDFRALLNVDPAVAGANGGFGIIRSRLDADLRSTSQLVWGQWFPLYGIDRLGLLPVWQSGVAQVGTSELVLEGVNFDTQPVVNPPAWSITPEPTGVVGTTYTLRLLAPVTVDELAPHIQAECKDPSASPSPIMPLYPYTASGRLYLTEVEGSGTPTFSVVDSGDGKVWTISQPSSPNRALVSFTLTD